MEMNELKDTWQAMQRAIERDSAINLALLRHQRLDRMRVTLRPLAAGQIAQIVLGVLAILLAAKLWSTTPSAVPVIIAGVLVHAYGIGCVMTAAITLGAVRSIGYSGSVVEVQGRLARIRQAYAISSIVAGFTWWFLWIPLLMVLAALVGVNLYAHAPSVVWIGCAIGLAGTMAMLGLYAASRSRPGLRRFIDGAIFGRTLQAAQQQIEEIGQFEAQTA